MKMPLLNINQVAQHVNSHVCAVFLLLTTQIHTRSNDNIE